MGVCLLGINVSIHSGVWLLVSCWHWKLVGFKQHLENNTSLTDVSSHILKLPPVFCRILYSMGMRRRGAWEWGQMQVHVRVGLYILVIHPLHSCSQVIQMAFTDANTCRHRINHVLCKCMHCVLLCTLFNTLGELNTSCLGYHIADQRLPWQPSSNKPSVLNKKCTVTHLFNSVCHTGGGKNGLASTIHACVNYYIRYI